MVLGDLRSFFTEDVLEKYDKLFENGHFTIYRNSPVTNELYKESNCTYPEYDYKTAYTKSEQLYFDEYRGILPKAIRILGSNKIYRNYECVFDPKPTDRELLYKNKPAVIFFDKGKCFLLFKCDGEIKKKEIIYFHCQKRNLSPDDKLKNSFYVTHNSICNKLSNEELNKILSGSSCGNVERTVYKTLFLVKKFLNNKYGIFAMIRRKKHCRDSEKYIENLRKTI